MRYPVGSRPEEGDNSMMMLMSRTGRGDLGDNDDEGNDNDNEDDD